MCGELGDRSRKDEAFVLLQNCIAEHNFMAAVCVCGEGGGREEGGVGIEDVWGGGRERGGWG